MRGRRGAGGYRRSLKMALVAAVLTLAGATNLGAQDQGRDVVVRVDTGASAGVPGWCRDQLDESLKVALTRSDCPVRSAREGEAADLIVSVQLISWRDFEESTGPSYFDPNFQETRFKLVCRALTRRRLEIHRAGVEKPVLADDKNFSGRASPSPTGEGDPRMEARREALGAVAEDATKRLCKQVKSLIRERARSSTPSR